MLLSSESLVKISNALSASVINENIEVSPRMDL